MVKNKDFPEEVKIKCLLWSDRHCCLCGRQCGTEINVHHIKSEGKNLSDIDNAIPLCLNCHSKIGAYNKEHPLGTKYKIDEIKARRDQVYEKHTRHLVPPIDFQVTQNIRGSNLKRRLPDVGFNITHLGDSHPVKIKVEARVKLGQKDLGLLRGHYGGGREWNMNPRFTFFGHTNIPEETRESDDRLEIDVKITIIDEYGRRHPLLPQGFVYNRKGNSWFGEPSVTWE